ncbi:MAG: CARDB domain-containing protein [Candidatus Poseidoniaceae archaeon]
MRRILPFLIVAIMVSPISISMARSVHATYAEDLFPQGSMSNPEDWEFKKHLAFTQENSPQDGDYVFGMVADNRMTLGVSLPEHKDEMTFWSVSTTTNSNASIGYPDGAYTYSTGPDITVGGFNVGSVSSNDITKVELMIHFNVPELLTQDKVRFSVINDGLHDLVKTWSNTQSGLYYMNNGWSMELPGYENLSWSEISNLEMNLDYVSNGATDDSQLQVDAVGLRIEMKTPWYGAERVTATAVNQFNQWPLIDLDFSTGNLDSVSIAPCGLESSSGVWTTDTIELPPEQSWGRIHVDFDDSQNGTVDIEYLSEEGSWIAISDDTIPNTQADTKFRFTIKDTCLNKAWVDINDPHINVNGSISGDISAMNSTTTRWTIVVNGKTVANYNGTQIGTFDYQIPIGDVLSSSDTEIEVKIKSWYSWENDGSESRVSLTINSIEIIGAYSIEYDEDPHCQMIGSHDLQEDGGGMILPYLSRCSDDRTSVEDLLVKFDNSNPGVVEVDLTEGQVRIRLIPEASGTSTITTTVTDNAGNTHVEISTINVAFVDDLPVLEDFIGTIPVEHGYDHEIPFSLYDIDTLPSDLTVYTNRSWATVDMQVRNITVNAPVPGFTSVLVTACDLTNCVEKVLDLEVRALSELFVEEIRINDGIRAGDVFDVKVFVRNSGQVTATMVSVRCTADEQTFGSGTIQVLEPGQMGSVICSMKAPEDDSSLIIEAEVDRGTTIDEVDETNNVGTVVIGIGEALQQETSSGSEGFDLGSGSIYTLSIVLVIVIIGLFGLLAPSKIKKVE